MMAMIRVRVIGVLVVVVNIVEHHCRGMMRVIVRYFIIINIVVGLVVFRDGVAGIGYRRHRPVLHLGRDGEALADPVTVLNRRRVNLKQKTKELDS